MPDKQIKFRRSDNGLYYCNVDYAIRDNQVVKPSGKKVTFKQNMVQTLDENKNFIPTNRLSKQRQPGSYIKPLEPPLCKILKISFV